MPRFRTCLDAVNARPMQIVGMSRRALFEQLDRPALRPLPASRYELATWKPCRVNIDYHVEAAHTWYSVPYQLVHAHVEARVTQTTVEVFLSGRRVASHARLTGRGRFSTQVAHMPRAHRAHAEWTPSRLIGWADQTGPATGRLVAGILERRPHPEQAIARVSGSCGWAGSTGWTGSTPPVRAPSGSAPTAIARSSTFSPTSRTGSRSTSPRLRDPP